jgi:hypothetical protein
MRSNHEVTGRLLLAAIGLALVCVGLSLGVTILSTFGGVLLIGSFA